MFGLVLLTDKAQKKVSILARRNFYRNQVVDLTGRISQVGITGQHFTFDCKWYDFALPYANGEFAKYYAPTREEKEEELEELRDRLELLEIDEPADLYSDEHDDWEEERNDLEDQIADLEAEIEAME